MKNVVKSLWNKEVIDTHNMYDILYNFTLIIYTIAILIYEFLYCNTSFTLGGMVGYNFSILRSILYIGFIIIISIFKDKFISSALEKFKNKKVLYKVALIEMVISVIILIIFGISFYSVEKIRFYAVLILALLMLKILIVYISKSYIKNIIVISATIALVYIITIDINNPIDEKKHFMSAFNISVGKFNFQQEPYMDKHLYDMNFHIPFYDNEYLYENNYKTEIVELKDLSDVFSTPSNYNQLTYIPAGVGIFVGNLLSNSIADIYYMGRLFNLIAYTILACITLSILPFKKNVFFIVLAMPMVIAMAGTYSVDFMCLGLISIFIAYCLKLYNKRDSITKKEMFILAILFSIMLICKNMIYIFVGLLIFMLPLKNMYKSDKRTFFLAILLAITGCVINFIVLMFLSGGGLVESDIRGGNGISVNEQIIFLLESPLNIFKVLLVHFRETFFNYNWLAGLNLQGFASPYGINTFLAFMIFAIIVAVLDDSMTFKTKDKVVIAITVITTFIISSLILYLTYTPVGLYRIAGYQTRYIIPLLPLVLMSCSIKSIKNNSKNPEIVISYFTVAFIFINVLFNILFHVEIPN